MINEICGLYDSNENPNKDLIFEKLGKLQELGTPPQELMNKIADQDLGGKMFPK